MIAKKHGRPSEIRQNMRGGEGSVKIEHIFTPQDFTAPTRLCAQITIPAAAGIGTHQHLQEDEVYLITGGSVIDAAKAACRQQRRKM